jgi:protease II
MSNIWWHVKVYHPATDSYTWLEKRGASAEQVKANLEEEMAFEIENGTHPDNCWVFVEAERTSKL